MNSKLRSIAMLVAAALTMTALSVVGAAAASPQEDTQPPQVYGVTVAPSPASLGDVIIVTAAVNDVGSNPRLQFAKFSVDGGSYTSMTPFDGTFDTPAEGVSGKFTAKKLGVHEVCVKARDWAGNESEPACVSLDVQSEISFGGFFGSVSNAGNNVKAGTVVPLDWAIVDGKDNPIDDRNAFRGVFSYEVDCGNLKGDPHSAEQEVGRFNQTLVSALTGGEWMVLWRPQMGYANTCRMVFVRFADGSTSPAVFFRFH